MRNSIAKIPLSPRWLSAKPAGAGGYLLKDLPPKDLARAVRLARAGVDQHDSAVLRRLVTTLDRGRCRPRPGPT